MEWESGCGSVGQEVLTTSVSDQCPILLDSSAITWGPVPVRFENVWL